MRRRQSRYFNIGGNLSSNKTRKPKIGINIFRITIFLGLVLLSLLLVIFLKSNLLLIKNVEIKSQDINCANTNEIKELISLQSSNIFLIDSSSIEQKLKNKFFCIDRVVINKISLNKIELEIFSRKAVALINSYQIIEDNKIDEAKKIASNSSNLSLESTPSAKPLLPKDTKGAKFIGKFIVDKTGFVFSQDSNELSIFQIDLINLLEQKNLPISSDLTLGSKVYQEIENAINILLTLQNQNVNFSTIQIIDGKTLLLKNEQIIIFNLSKDIDKQAASLQLIWQQHKIDSKDIEMIDLRFDKPIVKYSANKKN